jgi:hypothetical protein
MSERFTGWARRLAVPAREEGGAPGHGYPGTGHLLAGNYASMAGV